MNKYEENDLLKIIRKEADAIEIAHKYGTSLGAIRKALYRYGYRSHKMIKISSPYKDDVYVADKQKCADELRVSVSTVKRALKGYPVPTLDELQIKIEYVKDDEYDE